MSSLSSILRKALFDRENYCCLCFISIGDKFFSIEDEVLINNEKSEELYTILSTVIGDKVLDNISTKTICKLCTTMAINSYNFINKCRNNIETLHSSIESIQKHTKHLKEDITYFRSLYFSLDSCSYNVQLYYGKKQNCNPTLLTASLQDVQKESKQYFIEKDFESECSVTFKKHVVKKIKSKISQALQISDIVCNKDELNNYKCKTCMKVYQTGTKLKHHYLRVHAPKEYKCSQCSRSFGTLLLLNRHTKESHCTVVCSQCGKIYTNSYSLRHHERSHKLRLVCQTCGKIYKGKQALNNHIVMQLCKKMRKSNAEAKFTCDYCDKRYAQKTALSIHIRLEHENGKALICDWCGKKLSSISRLKSHVIKHTKQKNFECALCGGKFVTKASLLYHTRTHTGEKPYQCEHCDMSFLSASRRSEHVKRHHLPSSLLCDICHREFKVNASLMRHRKRHFDPGSKLYYKPSAPVQDGQFNIS